METRQQSKLVSFLNGPSEMEDLLAEVCGDREGNMLVGAGPSHRVRRSTNPEDWRSSPVNFKGHLKYIFETGELSDSRFSVIQRPDNQVIFEVPAHSFILNLWRAGEQVETSIEDKKTDFVHYTKEEKDVHDMKVFLRYLYTEEINQVEDYWGILHMANEFSLKDVAKNCRVYLRKCLKESNAVTLLEHAKGIEDREMLNELLPLVFRNAKKVIQSQEFLEIMQPFLCFLLQSNDFEVDEVELFQALMRWVEHACDKKKVKKVPKTMRKILCGAEKWIRLPLMTLRDVREVVIPSRIFEADYITSIIFDECRDPNPNSCTARSCCVEYATTDETQNLISLRSKLQTMFMEQRMTDVAFRDDFKEYGVHSFVLKLWSAEFEDILSGFNGEVLFHEQHNKSWYWYLIRDMYELETPRDSEAWFACAILAMKYRIPFLQEKYAARLPDLLCNNTALSFYIWAKEVNCAALLNLTKPFVVTNFASMVHGQEFFNLHEDDLCDILIENDLNIRELELFNSVVRWADARLEALGKPVNERTRKEQLLNVKKYIRFPLMTYEDITGFILPTSILSEEEQEEVILHALGEIYPEPKFNYNKRNLVAPYLPLEPEQSDETSASNKEEDAGAGTNHCNLCGIQFSTGRYRRVVPACGHAMCWLCFTDKSEDIECSQCANAKSKDDAALMPPPSSLLPQPTKPTKQPARPRTRRAAANLASRRLQSVT